MCGTWQKGNFQKCATSSTVCCINGSCCLSEMNGLCLISCRLHWIHRSHWLLRRHRRYGLHRQHWLYRYVKLLSSYTGTAHLPLLKERIHIFSFSTLQICLCRFHWRYWVHWVHWRHWFHWIHRFHWRHRVHRFHWEHWGHWLHWHHRLHRIHGVHRCPIHVLLLLSILCHPK